jgi:hypothetical protein
VRLGWAYFGLLLAAVLAYELNRGIYVGSEVVQVVYYYKHCRYLFPSGITVVKKGGWDSREEAQNQFCRLFHD